MKKTESRFSPTEPGGDRRLEMILIAVRAEYECATGRHGRFCSAHEGYAVLLEEVLELQAEVFKRHKDRSEMRKEAIQVAAMAVRFLVDICMEHPQVTSAVVPRKNPSTERLG